MTDPDPIDPASGIVAPAVIFVAAVVLGIIAYHGTTYVGHAIRAAAETKCLDVCERVD
jgi:adenosylmethionine-8-amino-7-oxononanoate aminotransferase